MTIDPKQGSDDFLVDAEEKAVRDRARRSGWGKPRPWLSLMAGVMMILVSAYLWRRAGGVDAASLVLAAAGLVNLWIGLRGLRTQERLG